MHEGLFEEPLEQFEDSMDLNAPAPSVSSGEWLRNGHWYAHQSAVYLSRSSGVKNSIILASDLASALEVHRRTFLQIPIDLGYAPGIRSTFGRYLGRDRKNRDHSVEATFLGLTHWGDSDSLTSVANNSIFTPLDRLRGVPAFNFSQFQSFDIVSDFNSYEINYRIDQRLDRDRLVYTRDSTWLRQSTPALLPSYFAGIRTIAVNERLDWFAQSDQLPGSTGTYRVQTHNLLVGPQFGMDLFIERNEWRVGMRGKGGALVNWTSQVSTVRIVDDQGTPLVPDRNEDVETHILSALGELNFLAAYAFRPNFSMRVSYDLLWVTNLTLAQNQATFAAAAPDISTQHTLFFQGVSFGFEFTR